MGSAGINGPTAVSAPARATCGTVIPAFSAFPHADDVLVHVARERAQPGQVVVVVLRRLQPQCLRDQRKAGVEARVGVDRKEILAEAERREAVLELAAKHVERDQFGGGQLRPIDLAGIVEESLRVGGTARFVGD